MESQKSVNGSSQDQDVVTRLIESIQVQSARLEAIREEANQANKVQWAHNSRQSAQINALRAQIETLQAEVSMRTNAVPLPPEFEKLLPRENKFSESRSLFFTGRETPLESAEFLKRFEQLILVTRISQEIWKNLIESQLLGDAKSWWVEVEPLLAKPLSWECFKKMFEMKYVPESAKMELSSQFAKLRQGLCTVEEYYTRFNRLKKFSKWETVNPSTLDFRFIYGLRGNIKNGCTREVLDTLADYFTAARKIEIELEEDILKRKSLARHLSGLGNPSVSKTSKVARSWCSWCRRTNHSINDCWRANGQCVRCGSSEHFAANCPNRRNLNGENQQNGSRALPTRQSRKRTFGFMARNA